MIDKTKYIKDASLLVKTAKSSRNKDIRQLTLNDSRNSILPTFRYLADGWRNLLAGLDGSTAKNKYTTYRTSFAITDSVLYALWTSNGMSRKIVNAVADDSTRNGISVENDSEHLLLNKFKKLGGLKNINEADKYRRHFGGAVIVMGIDDGGELWEEVRPNAIKEISWLKVYSRTDTFFTTINFTEDIKSENYGQPEFYTIIPKYTTPFNVHYTRVLEFKGLPVPTELDNDYRYYWGMSVVEPLWETLKKNGAALENIDQLLYELTIAIYKIKDLAKMICEKKWDDIKTIINTVDMSKSTIHAIIQDAEDSFQRDSLNFGGVKDILEVFMSILSGESEVPVSRLYGKQLGGLNNEGQNETRIYYDMIQARQANDLEPITQILIDYISISKEFANKVKDPIVSYNSPWQLTQKEELENRKTQSDIDHQQIEDQMISPEQAAQNRLVDGYSYEMAIESFEEQEGLTVTVPKE